MKRLGLLLCGVLALADCGGDGGSGPPTITAVVISGDSTVVLNGTRQLTATAMAGGSLLTTGVTFQWTSSDGTVAGVNGSGLVSGSQRGSVTISAQAVLNGTPTGVSGNKSIRVRIGSIVLSPTPSFSSLGDTVIMGALARDALNAPVVGVTFIWQSRAPSVATATATGPDQAHIVAVANGTARIVATGDGVSDSVTATVQQVATTLSVTPDTAAFDRLGATVTPAVTATDARGNAVPASAIGWTSQTPGVATVASTGVITSRGGGTARVIASSGTLADTVHVVVQQAPARVKLHPLTIDTSRIVATTGTMRMIDSVFDANDSLIRSPAPVITWSSTAAAASVDGTGLVTAGGSPGTTFIKAVSGTGSDSALVVVVNTQTTLSGNVQPIFNGNCAGCHFGPTGSAGMDLTNTHAFSDIVGVSAGESALLRAYPSRPDSSYLVHKVQGTHLVPPASGSGQRMPAGCSGASCLTKAQINIIRNWILQGALNN